MSENTFIVLLILYNDLLSCFQQCLKGLGIFTLHGLDFGVGVIGVFHSCANIKFFKINEW